MVETEKADKEKTTVVDAIKKLGAGVLDDGDAATDASSEEEYESAVSGVDATEVRRIGTQCACQAARWAHKWLVKDDEWWCEGDAMKEAVEAGDDEEFVKWHLENCNTNDSRWLMPLAASRGRVGILALLLERGLSFKAEIVKESIEAAAERGQVTVLRWFHENVRVGWSADVMDKAATHGHLDTVRWLDENRTEGCSEGAMDGAAENGHIDVVQWLHENRTEGCTTNAMDDAAGSGRYDVVTWLHSNRTEGCTTNAMTTAAQNDHLNIVKWLHKNRKEGCTTNAMDGAAMNGHLNVIKWLDKHRAEGCTTYAMDAAVVNRHWKIQRWLHSNRSEGCTTVAMDYAARAGQLNVVKWLHEHRTEGCTKYAMERAAGNGHLDVVKWLHANRSEGCSTDAMDLAAMEGHLHVVQWLHENRTEGCTKRAINLAAQSGHLEVVDWLHANRSERCTGDALKKASRSESQSINCEARNGHWYSVERLLRSRSEECDESILALAIEHRQLHIVKALFDREEFRSWPQPRHTRILADLFRSKGVLPRMLLQHITSRRKERYATGAGDNPSNAEFSELELSQHASSDERGESFELTAVSKVCIHLNLPDGAERAISEFIISDPGSRFSRRDAADRVLVHWLRRFSDNPSADIIVLAELGNLEGARVMHNHLRQEGNLLCSDQFKYYTIERGSLEFVHWHMRNCSDHSTESWLYLAVWIGRVDVIDWMCDHQAEVAHTMRTFPYSLAASFSTVESRYDLDCLAVEAWMDELEHGDQDEALLTESEREDLLVNVMDLGAARGFSGNIISARHKKGKPISGCSIGGLYGAIVNGHLNVIKLCYEIQKTLSSWPNAKEDGARVLRKIMSLNNHNCRGILEFFRQQRGMLLKPRDLREAVFCGDMKRVQLICELDLVDWATITTDAADVAATHGELEMLKLLHSKLSDLRCSRRAMEGAAEEGHFDVVKYLHMHGAPYTGLSVDLAARNGHKEVVQYLCEDGNVSSSPYAMRWASEHGHKSTVRYLASKRVRFDRDACVVLARDRGYVGIAVILEALQDCMGNKQWSSRYSQRRRRCIPRKSGLGEDGMQRRPLPVSSRTVHRQITQLVRPRGKPKSLQDHAPLTKPKTQADCGVPLKFLMDYIDISHRMVSLEDPGRPDSWWPMYSEVDYRGRARSSKLQLPGFTADELTVLIY